MRTYLRIPFDAVDEADSLELSVGFIFGTEKLELPGWWFVKVA